MSDGRHDHRPDRPVLLGPAGHRHAPGDVRRVGVVGRAHRRPRQRQARQPADLGRVPAAAVARRGAPLARPARGGPRGGRIGRRLGGRRRRRSGARVHAAARGRGDRVPGGTQRAPRQRACGGTSPATSGCTCTASPTACPTCWRRPTCWCTPPAGSPAWRRWRPAPRSSPTGCPWATPASTRARWPRSTCCCWPTTPTSCASTCARASPARNRPTAPSRRPRDRRRPRRSRPCSGFPGACARSRAGSCGRWPWPPGRRCCSWSARG